MIGIHDPNLSQSEFQEVLEALQSNWISGGGAKVRAFELEVQRFLGSKHSPVAAVNGSSALLLALRALGVSSGEHVLVSAYGFVATANAVSFAGASPIFVGPERGDDPVVNAEQIKKFFLEHVNDQGVYRATGMPIRGMLYNEPYGLASPDLRELVSFLESRGMFLVEDSSQAIGVQLSGRYLGTFGTMGVWSLNGNKTITTGAGGVLLGKDPDLLNKARKLQSQGRSDPFEFYYDEQGHNFLLSNVLAGIGLAQVRRLPQLLEAKIHVRKEYLKAFRGTPLRLLGENRETFPAWLNVVLFPKPITDRAKLKKLAESLHGSGFQVRPAFPAVTDYPMYRMAANFSLAHENELFHRGLCLPSGAAVQPSDVHLLSGLLLERAREFDLI